MRGCDRFDIPVPADLPAMLARVQALIVREGSMFAGDSKAGRFSGHSLLGEIESRYLIFAESIRITITNKPMLVPCSGIEERIRGYFR
jgi:hypothetical protein